MDATFSIRRLGYRHRGRISVGPDTVRVDGLLSLRSPLEVAVSAIAAVVVPSAVDGTHYLERVPVREPVVAVLGFPGTPKTWLLIVFKSPQPLALRLGTRPRDTGVSRRQARRGVDAIAVVPTDLSEAVAVLSLWQLPLTEDPGALSDAVGTISDPDEARRVSRRRWWRNMLRLVGYLALMVGAVVGRLHLDHSTPLTGPCKEAAQVLVTTPPASPEHTRIFDPYDPDRLVSFTPLPLEELMRGKTDFDERLEEAEALGGSNGFLTEWEYPDSDLITFEAVPFLSPEKAAQYAHSDATIGCRYVSGLLDLGVDGAHADVVDRPGTDRDAYKALIVVGDSSYRFYARSDDPARATSRLRDLLEYYTR